MLKFLKENFIYTNDCIILATPMVLFFVFLQIYLNMFQYNLSTNLSYLIFFFTLWVGISGCFAGWFYMVKKTLQFSQKTFLFDVDRHSALLKLFLCLFKGIGRFFLPFLTVIAISFIFKIAKLIFQIYVYNSSINAHYELISLISTILVFILCYWLIYWIPEIIYTYSNPFKAIINSFKKAYLSFKSTSVIYILLCVSAVGIHISLINSMESPFLYFLLLLLSYYFILYSVILIFRNYERNFVK